MLCRTSQCSASALCRASRSVTAEKERMASVTAIAFHLTAFYHIPVTEMVIYHCVRFNISLLTKADTAKKQNKGAEE